MKDFTFYAPTYVKFGNQSEELVASLIKRFGGHRVLLHYGGQSARRSGLLDKIKGLLNEEGIEFVELGGVVPNPRLSKVHEGIELCRNHQVDFILAVGGGSVIDSSKAIGYGVTYEGEVWDFYAGRAKAERCLPVGVVLTIPAAGSEMSEASVITNEDGGIKLGYSNDICRPKFAIMNPERTFTLPAYQTAAGVTDIMMHTMERYFNPDADMTITDEVAEALMRTMRQTVFDVLRDPHDYRARAQIMWAGSLAHNDVTGDRNNGDWATHNIEHELSGLFDVTHGAGLAAVWPSWARYVCETNVSRFVRFAVNVMGVMNDYTDPCGTAERGIVAMERFYHAIGMPNSLEELVGRPVTDEEIEIMASKCTQNDTKPQGKFRVLHQADVVEIYKMAR